MSTQKFFDIKQLITVVYAQLQQAIKTNHGRLMLLGSVVGLVYLPVWVGYLFPRALKGKIGWFLVLSMLLIAAWKLWQRRQVFSTLKASEEDRALGYLLIVVGIVVFPFCRFAMWPQALLWLLIIIGMACSTWGLKVFNKFMLPTFFIGLTVYPRIGIISRGLWDFFVPDQGLEKVMAWAGTQSMQWIGFPATQQGIFITFPEGAVEVGWGCNGLDMAITIAAAGLFMGLLYKQDRRQMVLLIIAAAIIAMIANVPRLMLVTIAHVYWGPEWFKFWHGFWGGQIFSGVLFTAYYYIVEALMKSQSRQMSG
ncbi:cyanoexosortase C [Leptothoe sp. ISB3NOV94-8A]